MATCGEAFGPSARVSGAFGVGRASAVLVKALSSGVSRTLRFAFDRKTGALVQ
jgi:hypothetical protein